MPANPHASVCGPGSRPSGCRKRSDQSRNFSDQSASCSRGGSRFDRMKSQAEEISVDRETLRVPASLTLAATYNREVRAGLDRIWENVLDWEHLPVLHEMYFDQVELLGIDGSGWRVALTKKPGSQDRRMLLELRVDRANSRYRVRTLAGDGAGTEIWTLLEPIEPHRTAVEVRYYLAEHCPDRIARLAETYLRSGERLWDQDEAMMTRREALLARRASLRQASGATIALGRLSELRRRLPLLFEVDGEPFRMIELEDGALALHATICPHWLGPLEEAAPENGILRCPWHGYLFDVRTGASADGRGYRLAPAPRLVVDPVTSEVTLYPDPP
jgi:nitrite reductase/ring-hydroxylating ferredoxin subunit